MSKLAPKNNFLDLSDYGRPIAKFIAKNLLNTPFTPIHVTFLFLIVGLIAIYFIIETQFVLAAVFLLLKSIIDAADGELARLRNKPSYIGRYLDSIFDLLLNFAILFTICYMSNQNYLLLFLAFIAMQMQGTVFNYYYIILRTNIEGGDKTSRIEEKGFPKALHGENQIMVNTLFIFYTIFYGGFDRIILTLDNTAKSLKKIPNWFMTLISIYGLGFQLFLIGLMLSLGLLNYILVFLIFYSIFIIVIIGLRKSLVNNY